MKSYTNPPRAKWTPEEDAALADYIAAGLSWAKIGNFFAINNPFGAHYQRAVRLGLHKTGKLPTRPADDKVTSTYIDTPPIWKRWGCVYDGHFWKAHTFDRLAFTHGHARAQAIMAGRDAATQADVAAWNSLGGRKAA